MSIKIFLHCPVIKRFLGGVRQNSVRLVCCFRKFTKGGLGRSVEEVCSLDDFAETLCPSVAPCRFSLPQTPALFASPVAVAVFNWGRGDTQIGATNLCRFSRSFAPQKPATSGRNIFIKRLAKKIGSRFCILPSFLKLPHQRS